MHTKIRRPGATRVLEHKLKGLQREQRNLEGLEQRGFVHDLDETTTQRRLREIRREIHEIEEVLADGIEE